MFTNGLCLSLKHIPSRCFIIFTINVCVIIQCTKINSNIMSMLRHKYAVYTTCENFAHNCYKRKDALCTVCRHFAVFKMHFSFSHANLEFFIRRMHSGCLSEESQTWYFIFIRRLLYAFLYLLNWHWKLFELAKHLGWWSFSRATS